MSAKGDLRDTFAAAALPAVVKIYDQMIDRAEIGNTMLCRLIAEEAYSIADAMMDERTHTHSP